MWTLAFLGFLIKNLGTLMSLLGSISAPIFLLVPLLIYFNKMKNEMSLLEKLKQIIYMLLSFFGGVLTL